MTETAGISALEELLLWWPVGAVLVLSLIALIWMTKNLLSSKDKMIEDKNATISILRTQSTTDKEKMFEFIYKVSSSLEKVLESMKSMENNQEKYRNKTSNDIELLKDKFISLPCKTWKKS